MIKTRAIGPFEVEVQEIPPVITAFAMVRSVEQSGFNPTRYMESQDEIDGDGGIGAYENMLAVITLFVELIAVMGYIEIHEAYRRLYTPSLAKAIRDTKDQKVIDSQILTRFLFPSAAERVILCNSILMSSGIISEGEDILDAFFQMSLAATFSEAMGFDSEEV